MHWKQWKQPIRNQHNGVGLPGWKRLLVYSSCEVSLPCSSPSQDTHNRIMWPHHRTWYQFTEASGVQVFTGVGISPVHLQRWQLASSKHGCSQSHILSFLWMKSCSVVVSWRTAQLSYQPCIFECTCTRTCTHTCTLTRTCMHTYMHTRTCMHTQVYNCGFGFFLICNSKMQPDILHRM